MQLSANPNKATPEIVVSHRDESLVFSGNVFSRKGLQSHEKIFAEINSFWDTMSPSEQDKVFDIYRQVNENFDTIRSADELNLSLTERIKELIRHHDFGKLRLWLSMNPNIYIPPEFADDFVEDIDSNYTADKTYTKGDYIGLLTLAMFFRTLVPIWGEYVSSITREVGKSNKEFQAMRLLTGTGVMETPQFNKLMSYIRNNIGPRSDDPTKIIEGFASEDMPYAMTALVSVRRLCVATFDDSNDDDEDSEKVVMQTRRPNLVSKIYKFVYQRVFSQGGTDDGIRRKKLEEAGGEHGKRSIFEGYRYRQEFSIGELTEMVFAISNPHGYAEKLAPGIDHDFLEECLQTARTMRADQIVKPQILLLSYILAPIISPRAIMYLPGHNTIVNPKDGKKPGGYVDRHGQTHYYYDKHPELVREQECVIIDAIGVAQAVLWHYGHRYLSLLISCYPEDIGGDMVVATIDSRAQIPHELKNEIYRLYPHVGTTLKRSTSEVTTESHKVLEAIDMITDDLLSYVWRPTAKDYLLEAVIERVQRRYPIHPGIKPDLAKFIIDIGSRKFRK